MSKKSDQQWKAKLLLAFLSIYLCVGNKIQIIYLWCLHSIRMQCLHDVLLLVIHPNIANTWTRSNFQKPFSNQCSIFQQVYSVINGQLGRQLQKKKYWSIIGLFCVTLEFQPKMKNLIYRDSTGFLNYPGVLTNSVILLCLQNALLSVFPSY